MDNASTQTYIIADIAAQLGLQGKFQQVTVNVPNGQIKTFDTMPVEFELVSLNGLVDVNMSAFTAAQVTGNAGISFIHNHPPPRDTTCREQKPSPWDNHCVQKPSSWDKTGSQKPYPWDIKLENFTNVSINSDTI